MTIFEVATFLHVTADDTRRSLEQSKIICLTKGVQSISLNGQIFDDKLIYCASLKSSPANDLQRKRLKF